MIQRRNANGATAHRPGERQGRSPDRSAITKRNFAEVDTAIREY
jgi:hypothetical protein